VDPAQSGFGYTKVIEPVTNPNPDPHPCIKQSLVRWCSNSVRRMLVMGRGGWMCVAGLGWEATRCGHVVCVVLAIVCKFVFFSFLPSACLQDVCVYNVFILYAGIMDQQISSALGWKSTRKLDCFYSQSNAIIFHTGQKDKLKIINIPRAGIAHW
jgi:hypothetical protein